MGGRICDVAIEPFLPWPKILPALASCASVLTGDARWGHQGGGLGNLVEETRGIDGIWLTMTDEHVYGRYMGKYSCCGELAPWWI